MFIYGDVLVALTVLVHCPVNALLVEVAALGVSIRAPTRDSFRMVGNPEVTIGPSVVRQVFAILSRVNHPPILLGTSSFTAAGWDGSFFLPASLRGPM